jgi:negative regulator of sigma-B (phosphoserine phosphatase)
MGAPHCEETPMIDWSIAARPIAGESVSGDVHVVKPYGHRILVAAIDGIGHGKEAAIAAQIAADILGGYQGESIISLVKQCHKALLLTRGVVLAVAKMNAIEDTMTWLGVGNVQGRLLHADTHTSHSRESILMRGGLVGYRLPMLQVSVVPVVKEDLLILATDGIHTGFADNVILNETPQQIADKILTRHAKATDDALVLVARYRGGQNE